MTTPQKGLVASVAMLPVILIAALATRAQNGRQDTDHTPERRPAPRPAAALPAPHAPPTKSKPVPKYGDGYLYASVPKELRDRLKKQADVVTKLVLDPKSKVFAPAIHERLLPLSKKYDVMTLYQVYAREIALKKTVRRICVEEKNAQERKAYFGRFFDNLAYVARHKESVSPQAQADYEMGMSILSKHGIRPSPPELDQLNWAVQAVFDFYDEKGRIGVLALYAEDAHFRRLADEAKKALDLLVEIDKACVSAFFDEVEKQKATPERLTPLLDELLDRQLFYLARTAEYLNARTRRENDGRLLSWYYCVLIERRGKMIHPSRKLPGRYLLQQYYEEVDVPLAVCRKLTPWLLAAEKKKLVEAKEIQDAIRRVIEFKRPRPGKANAPAG